MKKSRHKNRPNQKIKGNKKGSAAGLVVASPSASALMVNNSDAFGKAGVTATMDLRYEPQLVAVANSLAGQKVVSIGDGPMAIAAAILASIGEGVGPNCVRPDKGSRLVDPAKELRRLERQACLTKT